MVMVVIMIMMVMIVTVVMMMAGGMNPLVQHPRTNSDNRQPGNRSQDPRHLFRHDVLKQKHGGQTQQEHAHRMRERHHRSQKNRVLDSAARTHQISRNNRLPMSGRERMRRAQNKSNTHCRTSHPRREFLL